MMVSYATTTSEKEINTYWLPNSAATYRKPVFSTHIAEATGTVSKYLSFISVTTSSSVSMVTLKISPWEQIDSKLEQVVFA